MPGCHRREDPRAGQRADEPARVADQNRAVEDAFLPEGEQRDRPRLGIFQLVLFSDAFYSVFVDLIWLIAILFISIPACLNLKAVSLTHNPEQKLIIKSSLYPIAASGLEFFQTKTKSSSNNLLLLITQLLSLI